jgi:4-amino-4-deoxy-L-arabinose transferase-like glycosyltransferase
MSRISPALEAPARGASRPRAASETSRFRLRRRISVAAAIVVFGWSVVELGSLIAVHTSGPELYGVLVAGLAVTAGALGLIALRSSERTLWATVAVLVVWAVVALGGVAGVAAHVIGPGVGHGPIDPRPRPIAAPLVFTLLGFVGGAALWFGQRRSTRHPGTYGEEDL